MVDFFSFFLRYSKKSLGRARNLGSVGEPETNTFFFLKPYVNFGENEKKENGEYLYPGVKSSFHFQIRNSEIDDKKYTLIHLSTKL